ncbi:MAG: hypothetical protein Q7U63_12150 [Polaromonas sp.]|uniref:hypothetical protein n=1 Tax=Polaromonas sp. TaxID=1869339 RepID=UPI0027207EDC|nr:hypothetical protein [Polaromonas sp.]MDO9114529.1 hypothetical protein [Polaromonas sp.]
MNSENAASNGTILYRVVVIGLLLLTVAFSYEARQNAEMASDNAASASDGAHSAASAIRDIDACSRR